VDALLGHSSFEIVIEEAGGGDHRHDTPDPGAGDFASQVSDRDFQFTS
jgi:hypothetical protein